MNNFEINELGHFKPKCIGTENKMYVTDDKHHVSIFKLFGAMPVREALDKRGNTLKFLEVNGKRFPAEFSEDIIRKIPNGKVREDDVLICGYLRSGTHWMFEMLHMLMNGNAETVPLWKGQQMLEFTSQSDLEKQQSPRVLNTHLYCSELPRDVPTLGNKIVYVLRDPRDLAASYYRLLLDIITDYPADWDTFLDIFYSGEVQWGSWFDHINRWEPVIKNKEHENILTIFYEDTHKDPVKTVQRLSDFLGLHRSATLIAEKADKCGFSNVKKDKEKYSYIVHDRNVMCRKGMVGDWKNCFTVAQSEMFDKILREMVGNSRLVQRYLHECSF